MEKVVKFFKFGGHWYADIPNHTLEENEMVMGADDVIELISNGENEVRIKVSDECPLYDTAQLVLLMAEHDDEGAWYELQGSFLPNILSCRLEQKIWMCNVVHDVFGEHPEKIYLVGMEVNGSKSLEI